MIHDRKTILIVDDTPLDAGIIAASLKDHFKTSVATNGRLALTMARANDKPDLILLDVMMSEMDGYEVCRRLKAGPLTRDIPVIFLTARTDVEDETKGYELGAVDYIHKPFSPPIVLARVTNHVALQSALNTARDLSDRLAGRTKNWKLALQLRCSASKSSRQNFRELIELQPWGSLPRQSLTRLVNRWQRLLQTVVLPSAGFLPYSRTSKKRVRP